MSENGERRATDQLILDKLEYMDKRREEQHEENLRRFDSHEASDEKRFEDHEGRLRHIEKWVWGAIGALVLLHGAADVPKIIQNVFAK